MDWLDHPNDNIRTVIHALVAIGTLAAGVIAMLLAMTAVVLLVEALL